LFIWFKKNILVGICGGLDPNSKSGNLMVVDYSDGNESATRMYNPNAKDNRHYSDQKLTDSLFKKASEKYSVKRGSIITCQAFLAETWQDVEKMFLLQL
jgi:purine-nucleoside phosphorylase